MLDKVWILPALMAAAFVITLFFGKKLPYKGAEVGTAAIAIGLILSIVASIQWIGRSSVEGLRPAVDKSISWYKDGNIDVRLGIHVDGFTVAMLFTVAFISLCVHVFSIEYLRDDTRFTHYFAALNLFTGAMLWMVQSATTLGLLFGWELMGLCSFLLIGHWWEEKKNTDAALKAFFTTRTGDIGLLIGITILFFASGKTFDISKINEMALSGELSHRTLLIAASCLFLGVIGKSAQFPLHTWLPDAMAGPTPASSLIHAATMVVAGVYLFARLYGVFWMGFSIEVGGMNVGAWVGSITLLTAAALAFVQTDIKKVLAYSTVSQLGYMVMGLSVGSWGGAIFHLFTHAFFKALLFQASGSIAHSGSHHSFEMDQMGGLRKYMKTTHATFLVGFLALAGVFPFSGFWSKDEILLGALKNHYTVALVAGLIGSFMTACYMTRAYWKTFQGENHLVGHGSHDVQDGHDAHGTLDAHAMHDAHAAADAHGAHGAHDDHGHGGDPHESPRLITGPLIALAVMAGIAGFFNLPGEIGGVSLPWKGDWFGHWIEGEVFEKTLAHAHMIHGFNGWLALGASACGLSGLAVGYWYNAIKGGDLGIVRRGGLPKAIHTFLKNKYYLDYLWTDVVVGTIKGPIAQAAYWINQNILDAVVNGAGRSATGIGRFTYNTIDQGLIDGIVNGSGKTAWTGGGIFRRLQSGRVQAYAALFLGTVGLIGMTLALFVK